MISLPSAWSEFDVARHKAEFYRMWHVGHRAGLSHPLALEAVGDFRRSRTVLQLRQHLLTGTRQRQTLRQIVQARPELFDTFEAGLLELGEETGKLEDVFKLLGDYFTAEHRMVLWVKKKMSYPMINALAAIFILPFPILFFGNATLYLLIVLGELIAAFMVGGTLLAAAVGWYRSRPKLVMARLCRALALGVEAGLPLGRVVDLGIKAAASRDLSAHVARFPSTQRGGQPLAITFRGTKVVPHEVIAALEVADASGNYGDTLRKLADLYDSGYGR